MPDIKKQSEANKQVHKIEDFCRSHGYKFSQQRKNVLLQLITIDEFIDAEALWFLVMKHADISLASIYNSLRWLESHGFIEKDTSNKKGAFKYKS